MPFPGKVIENLWFVSLSCLRVQVLVRVPNFFWLYFWKWFRKLRAGVDRAREVPIGFRVQRLNHWVIIAILTLILFWWNPIPSSDKFLLALIFVFLLRVVLVVVSKRCRLHVLSRKSNWESLVRQSQLLANTSVGSCSQLLLNIFLKMRSKAAGRARSCAGCSHWILSPTPSPLSYHSYFHINLVLMESDSVLGQIFACANLRFFCWGLSWWSFPNAVAYMPFPGKVIKNLWFVSLSCLRVQVLVRVPNFSRIYFWKKRSNGASRARSCAGISHWISSPTPSPLSYHSYFDINLVLMESDSGLGQFFACANLHFFCWGLSWWSFPNAVAYMSFPGKVIENLWLSVSVACEHKCWFVFPTSSEYFSENEIEGCEQGSSVRGKFPLGCKSNALTSCPSQLFWQ